MTRELDEWWKTTPDLVPTVHFGIHRITLRNVRPYRTTVFRPVSFLPFNACNLFNSVWISPRHICVLQRKKLRRHIRVRPAAVLNSHAVNKGAKIKRGRIFSLYSILYRFNSDL